MRERPDSSQSDSTTSVTLGPHIGMSVYARFGQSKRSSLIASSRSSGGARGPRRVRRHACGLEPPSGISLVMGLDRAVVTRQLGQEEEASCRVTTPDSQFEASVSMSVRPTLCRVPRSSKREPHEQGRGRYDSPYRPAYLESAPLDPRKEALLDRLESSRLASLDRGKTPAGATSRRTALVLAGSTPARCTASSSP